MEDTKQIEEPIKKEESNKFNLLEWTTIIYAILTFLGYSYMDSFYSEWKINIFTFLDISEILLVFLNNFNYLLIISFYSSILFILFAILFPINKYGKKLSNIIYPDKASSKKKNRNYIIFVIVVYLLFLSITYITNLYENNDDLAIVSIYLTTIAIISIVMIKIILPFLMKKYNITIKFIYLILITLFINVFIFNITSARYSKLQIDKKKTNTKFYFNYESKIYKTNDTLLFIGATSKYIFIRNTKDTTNLIFNKDSVKNFSLTLNFKK